MQAPESALGAPFVVDALELEVYGMQAVDPETGRRLDATPGFAYTGSSLKIVDLSQIYSLLFTKNMLLSKYTIF
jgi:hypothetical protein